MIFVFVHIIHSRRYMLVSFYCERNIFFYVRAFVLRMLKLNKRYFLATYFKYTCYNKSIIVKNFDNRWVFGRGI